jgi:hypothetical protein
MLDPAAGKIIAFPSYDGVPINSSMGPGWVRMAGRRPPSPSNYDVIDDLIKQGKVIDSRVDFARAGVGVTVKAGAPKPDIGTPEAFKHAMLAAKSIAHSTGASGIIAAKLMERLGIAEQLKGKIKLVDGVRWPRSWQRAKPRSACSRSTSFCPLPAPTTSVRCRRSYRATSISLSACWRCRSPQPKPRCGPRVRAPHSRSNAEHRYRYASTRRICGSGFCAEHRYGYGRLPIDFGSNSAACAAAAPRLQRRG